jgi:hypothetical protein
MQGLAAATYVAAPDGLAAASAWLLIPVVAVVLIVAGLIRLVRATKAPGYPPPGYQQPGYPPYPAAPPSGWQGGYPPPPPPPPRPPAQPGKTTGIAMLAAGVVIFLVSLPLALGQVIATIGAPTDSGGFAVGQCTTDTAVTSGSLEAQPMDCDDPDAVMELVSISDTNTCPDGEPPSTSLYASVSDDQTAYCFIPNLKQGNCYAINTVGRQSLKVDDCANLSPRVVKRVDGSSDASVCDADSTAVVFPEPQRVYCFEGL